jgi:hypothetical protein
MTTQKIITISGTPQEISLLQALATSQGMTVSKFIFTKTLKTPTNESR